MDLDMVGDAIWVIGNDALGLFRISTGSQVDYAILSTEAASNEYIVRDGQCRDLNAIAESVVGLDDRIGEIHGYRSDASTLVSNRGSVVHYLGCASVEDV